MIFIIYNEEGKILRKIGGPLSQMSAQIGENEFMLEGDAANDITQKIVDGKIVNKTPEEILTDNPLPIEIPYEDRQASFTNKQLQDILGRLSKLED